MHRVFCATSWELEGERRAFYDVVGRVNEQDGMPRGILFVPVSLTNIRDKRPLQYAVEENLAACRYCLFALEDGWGPPERNFERDFRLALRHRADCGSPMQCVEVLVRVEPDRSPPPFLEQLSAAGIGYETFPDTAAFSHKLEASLRRWLQELTVAVSSSAV